MNKILWLALFSLMSSFAAAEELYRFPSGSGAWTVTCESRSGDRAKLPDAPAPAAAAIMPEKIEVAQNDDVARSVIRYSNGRRQELWSVPKLGVILTEEPTGEAFVTREIALYGDPFSPSNFNWVKRDNRVGDTTVKFEGADCLHYKGVQVMRSPFGEAKPVVVPCEAWVNAETLQPVALLKGNLLGRYAFGEPPGELTIPEKFQKRLKYYKISMGMQ